MGLIPKHIEEYPLNGMAPRHFLVLANEAAQEIGWSVPYISESGLIAYTDKGMFSQNAEIKITIENSVATIRSESLGNAGITFGANRKNINEFIEYFEDFKCIFPETELEKKFQAMQGQFVSPEEDILKLPPETTADKINGFFSIFKPRQGYFITPILIDLNILVFVLMAISGVNIFSPDSESLLRWGANFTPMTLDGEWWRLITSCFVHIGIFHLLMNMYALLYIGILLESHLGRARFLSAYLLTGIVASVASLWWNDLIISAGASGAIFGMYGVFLALLTTNLIEKTGRKALLTSIVIFVIFNLVYGMKEGIDNAAHIGGLIGGLVIGYAFIPGLKKQGYNLLKYGTIALLALATFIISFSVCTNTPNDVGTYNTKMEGFVEMEEKALSIFQLPTDMPPVEMLKEIQNTGIYNWEQGIKLFDSFDELDLPEAIRNRNQILKEYCELRIKSYELLFRSVAEDTDQYNQQLESYNQQIEAKLKEFQANE